MLTNINKGVMGWLHTCFCALSIQSLRTVPLPATSDRSTPHRVTKIESNPYVSPAARRILLPASAPFASKGITSPGYTSWPILISVSPSCISTLSCAGFTDFSFSSSFGFFAVAAEAMAALSGGSGAGCLRLLLMRRTV